MNIVELCFVMDQLAILWIYEIILCLLYILHFVSVAVILFLDK